MEHLPVHQIAKASNWVCGMGVKAYIVYLQFKKPALNTCNDFHPGGFSSIFYVKIEF
jgi:hypothetical protein